MSTSPAYSLRHADHFEHTYRKLKKSYANSGGADVESLNDCVAGVLKALRNAPTAREVGCEKYTLPTGVSSSAWELWRITFSIPGVKGAARHGRIMYVIHKPTCTVVLFWIYNHQQFEKRPPDKDIRRQLKAIFTA